MRLWVILLAATACYSQDFTQRGFIETRLLLYPQTVPADSGRVIDEVYLEYEFSKKISTGLRVYGAFEAQTDTHRQTERTFDFSWLDRKIRRPLFGVRRLSASYTKGPLNIELGKQSVRWGKADILNPTDRFAPRDFLSVFHPDYLSITGSRLIYGGQSNTIDLVFVPFFTPSRAPLFNQRWVNLPQTLPLNDLGARYPGGTQFGGRFNHIGKVAEWSISYFDGYNNLPLIDYALTPSLPPRLDVQRRRAGNLG